MAGLGASDGVAATESEKAAPEEVQGPSQTKGCLPDSGSEPNSTDQAPQERSYVFLIGAQTSGARWVAGPGGTTNKEIAGAVCRRLYPDLWACVSEVGYCDFYTCHNNQQPPE